MLNITSIGGTQGSSKFSGLSAYSSSKGAVTILTECLAEEFKSKNISVNALALGAVQTEMLEKAFPGYKAPMTDSEMAKFVAWFAVNGNKFFNGKVLPVALSSP
jgi:NAD(P)-dependent dehydrogenase (short-subunit alcohol dehydrogenase family)